MNTTAENNAKTRELLLKYCQQYPNSKPQDIFKYIFQSVFGCEHMVSNEDKSLEFIKEEYKSIPNNASPLTEQLDGKYSRVHLSWLNNGLKAETLAKLFCLSAKKEADGIILLESKLQIAKELVYESKMPFDTDEFNTDLNKWRESGYPAIHHSNNFREEYKPSYRVIANQYAIFMPIFAEIDKVSSKDHIIVAIDGGSASGKTTLSDILKQIYDCNVFHMDDYFLRPEQRTADRLAEIGGNVDRERFYDEILQPLSKNETVYFRRFDCQKQSLGEIMTVVPNKLTVIEGTYSMYPEFHKYYDLSIFLDIEPDHQRKRILIRNTPIFAERFFNEWIPLENKYFTHTSIKERSGLVFPVHE